MIKNKFKSNKGFTGTDIVISLIILVIFTGILVTTFYNYYLSVTSKNRNAIATNCIIDIIENIEMLSYEDITQEKIDETVKLLYDNNTIPSQYTVTTKLQNYNEIEGNENKFDVIKKVTVKIKYIVGNKDKELEINRLITKY